MRDEIGSSQLVATAGAVAGPQTSDARWRRGRSPLLAAGVVWFLAATGPAGAEPAAAGSPESGQIAATEILSEEENGVTTTQRYELYIDAPAQKIWDAITTSAWTERYGYQGRVDYELKPGGVFRAYATPGMVEMGIPEVAIDGEVLAADPPRKLVHTYRFLFSDDTKAEGFTRLSWEIEENGAGFSRLTLTHELEGAPIMAGMVASPFSEMGTGGWSWILSDLKTLLETGKRLGQR